jgi:hypothetical protein
MVHLSVAHCLVRFHGYPSSPAFYLGNVAPDAIHARAGSDRRDKNAVHLAGDGADQLSGVRHLVEKEWPSPDEAAFAVGYSAHILTDRYWREVIFGRFIAALDAPLPRHELRTLYYNECDKVDLDLYDRQSWRRDVWALLRAAQASDFEGLLSREEIGQWQERVLSWFDQNRHKGDHMSRYISTASVLDFIVAAAAHVHEQLAQWTSPPTSLT